MWTHRVTTLAFGYWVAYACQRCQFRRLLRAALANRLRAQMQRAMHAWREFLAAQVRKRARLRMARASVARYKLCLTFDAWWGL